MKKLILLLSFIMMGLIGIGQTIHTSHIIDTVSKGNPIYMQKAGSCGSPDGSMNPTIISPPSYVWLQSNGYCNPNSYGNNPTVCWTFTPTSSSVTINSGYSQSGCNNVSFGSFNLYDNSCNLIGTGFNFSTLNAGQTYTWCMTGLAWGGGPSCTGFNDFCPYYFNNIVLPIELVDFDVYNKNGVNVIYWVTVSEINNDYYILDRSVDGYDWEMITQVDGAGNSSTGTLYEFKDNTYKNVRNYYRLTQVDFDGKQETFNIITINNYIEPKERIKVLNFMGQPVDENYRGLVIEIYSDGSTRKVLRP